jgi:hypothetical protein
MAYLTKYNRKIINIDNKNNKSVAIISCFFCSLLSMFMIPLYFDY